MCGFSSSYKDTSEGTQNICVFAVGMNREADVQSDSQASIIVRFFADQINKEKLHMTEAAGCLEVRRTLTPRTTKLLGNTEESTTTSMELKLHNEGTLSAKPGRSLIEI